MYTIGGDLIFVARPRRAPAARPRPTPLVIDRSMPSSSQASALLLADVSGLMTGTACEAGGQIQFGCRSDATSTHSPCSGPYVYTASFCPKLYRNATRHYTNDECDGANSGGDTSVAVTRAGEQHLGAPKRASDGGGARGGGARPFAACCVAGEAGKRAQGSEGGSQESEAAC